MASGWEDRHLVAGNTCFSRLVALPVDMAAHALDLADALAAAQGAPWRLPVGDHLSLRLGPVVGVGRAVGRYGPVRRARGTLEDRGLRLPVEVELAPWCCHRSELFVRLATRRRLSAGRVTDRYTTAALRALACLDHEISSWSRALFPGASGGAADGSGG